MLISIFPGVIAFILTVIGIPAFIRFYHKSTDYRSTDA